MEDQSIRKELVDLLNKWDPIGVEPSKGGPKDEYDCFVIPLLSMLEANKSKDDISGFLINHLEEHIGLNAKYHKPEKFAEKIVRWYKNR